MLRSDVFNCAHFFSTHAADVCIWFMPASVKLQISHHPVCSVFVHSNWCFASPLDKKNLKLISLPLESQPPYQLAGNCQVLCWIIQTFQTINTNFINYLLPHYIVLFYLCSAIFFDNTNLHLSTSSTRGWWVLGFCVLIINSVD